MQVVVIINLINAYEIRLKLQPVSINTHCSEVLLNLALPLPKSIFTSEIKFGHRCILRDIIQDNHLVLQYLLKRNYKRILHIVRLQYLSSLGKKSRKASPGAEKIKWY